MFENVLDKKFNENDIAPNNSQWKVGLDTHFNLLISRAIFIDIVTWWWRVWVHLFLVLHEGYQYFHNTLAWTSIFWSYSQHKHSQVSLQGGGGSIDLDGTSQMTRVIRSVSLTTVLVCLRSLWYKQQQNCYFTCFLQLLSFGWVRGSSY